MLKEDKKYSEVGHLTAKLKVLTVIADVFYISELPTTVYVTYTVYVRLSEFCLQPHRHLSSTDDLFSSWKFSVSRFQ